MKNYLSRLILPLLGIFIVGCNYVSGDLSNSMGGTYEIMVIAKDGVWKGSVGDTLRAVLTKPVGMMNQSEPLFDVLRVGPELNNNVIDNHRNLLRINVDAKYTQPSIIAAYDVNSKPQIIVTAMAPNDSVLTAYVWEHRQNIIDIFDMAERERAIATYKTKRGHQIELEKEISKMFGIEMTIPAGYKIRSKSENFIWMSLEYPKASQGFFIYSYPFTSVDKDLKPEALVDRRDHYASLIPGELDHSYMTTYKEVEPSMANVRIYGRVWAEMRGFWDVHGDFMGGPFVSYSTISYAQNKIVTIDGYVFSPEKPKRNFLRQIENLVYTVKFPEDVASQSGK